VLSRATTQHELEIARRPPPDRLGLLRRPAETTIEVRQKRRQERIGGRPSGRAPQPELAHEPILQRGPETFDAAFGLGRPGLDIPDAELLQHAPDVSRRLGARQLFRQTPVAIIAHQDVDPVAVERHRQAGRGEDVPEQRHVAVHVFGGPEMQRHHLRGRVVDGAQQREARAAGLEPVERAAVELQHLARGRLAGPPGAVLGGPPAMHGAQAQRAGRRRTDSREMVSPWSSRSVSVRWVSLKPA
jgi:hypothetical protein